MTEKEWKGNSDAIGIGEALEHRAKWREGANHLKILREKQSWQKKSGKPKGRGELGFMGEHQRYVWLKQPRVSERWNQDCQQLDDVAPYKPCGQKKIVACHFSKQRMLPVIPVNSKCYHHQAISHCTLRGIQDREKQDTGPRQLRCISKDFPGGAVVKNPPANAGGTRLSPGAGRSHVLWSN